MASNEWISENKVFMLLVFLVIAIFSIGGFYHNINETNANKEQTLEMIKRMEILGLEFCPECYKKSLEKIKKSHNSDSK